MFTMIKVRLTSLIVLSLMIVVAAPAVAGPPPLPPLPAPSVVTSVINQTSGAQFTPLNASGNILSAAAQFGGVFASRQLAVHQSVHYITTTGTLRESIIPMANLRTSVLDPDMTAPGSWPRPGKILGVVHQPTRGVYWVVAVFKAEAAQCPSCYPPEKIRFYRTATQYYEYSIKLGAFADPEKDKKVALIDEGAVITHKLSCVAVGIEQACWEPYLFAAVRDEAVPKTTIYAAYTQFKVLFDLRVDFYVDDAVPDLIGRTQRNQCASLMGGASKFTSMTACTSNVVISAAKTSVANQPIAIIVVRSTADIRTFNTSGQYIGGLPAGSYLVFPARATGNAGESTALFLVGTTSSRRYLIPSTSAEGMGSNPNYPQPVAGIKDGFVRYRAFGW